jgi:hypothetical protein
VSVLLLGRAIINSGGLHCAEQYGGFL